MTPKDPRTATYRKVTVRLIPFLFARYILAYLDRVNVGILAYLDRVNVGFAKLQMQSDLGMSETVYGMGAGLFFIDYFLWKCPPT